MVLFAAVVVIAGNSLIKNLEHDEHMYVAGGVLMAEGKVPWRDFSYVSQMPYHPLLLAAVYKITGTDNYLLWGRIVSIICDCVIAAFLFLIILQFTGKSKLGPVIGLAAVIVYLFNPLVDYANGRAWNHDVVITLCVSAFWVYIHNNWKIYIRSGVVGAILAAAVFMRVTTVIIAAIFFMALLLGNKNGDRLKSLGAFFVGVLILSMWPIYVAITNWDAFFVHAVLISQLTGEFVKELGMSFNKFRFFISAMTIPNNLTLHLVFLSITAVTLKYLKITKEFLLAIFIAMGFYIIAFIPPSPWLQYFAMPVVFVIIASGWSAGQILQSRSKEVLASVFIFVLLTIILFAKPLGYFVGVLNKENWAPTKVHAKATEIRTTIGVGKRILTLSPIYVLESGNKIYSQLAAGPFAYRVADAIPEKLRKQVKLVGPQNLGQLLEKPDAVLVGEEPKFLEEPITQLAEKNWIRKRLDSRLMFIYSNSPTSQQAQISQ